jgi:hypothetical protein
MWLLVGLVYAACDGQVEAPCEPGFMSCGEGETDGGNFSASGGCETDTMSDPNHCGGCTIQCTASCLHGVCVPFTAECIPPCEEGESCVAGACLAPKTCESPLTKCGGGCVDVEANDSRNCGGCGIHCNGDCVHGQCLDAGLADAASPPDDGGGFDTGVADGGGPDTGVSRCETPCEALAQCDTSNPSLSEECKEFCTGPTIEDCFAEAAEEMGEVGQAGYCNLLALCVWQGYFASECEGMVPTWDGDSCGGALGGEDVCTSESCICDAVNVASSSYAFVLLDINVCSEVNCTSSCPPDDVSPSSACYDCQMGYCGAQLDICIAAEP